MDYPIQFQLAFLFQEYEVLEEMLVSETPGKDYLSRLNKDLKEISSKLIKASDSPDWALCVERGETTKPNQANAD